MEYVDFSAPVHVMRFVRADSPGQGRPLQPQPDLERYLAAVVATIG
jgi:hypothetical protein